MEGKRRNESRAENRRGACSFSRTLFLSFPSPECLLPRSLSPRSPFLFHVSACGSALFYLQERVRFLSRLANTIPSPTPSAGSISLSSVLSFTPTRRNQSSRFSAFPFFMLLSRASFPPFSFSLLLASFSVSFLRLRLLFMHLPILEPSPGCSLGRAGRCVKQRG